MVTDVKPMTDAGQSRCEMYRLGPLTAQESRQLAQGFLAASAVSYDARVVDLILAASDGAPSGNGFVQRRCQRGGSDSRPSTLCIEPRLGRRDNFVLASPHIGRRANR
jgi:hypothetical protein